MKHKEIFLKGSSLLFGSAYDCDNSGWDRRSVLNKRDGVSISGTGHSSLFEMSGGRGESVYFFREI
jgi:hypothetical protein